MTPFEQGLRCLLENQSEGDDKIWLIMVVELSGVQFGLKSYSWF